MYGIINRGYGILLSDHSGFLIDDAVLKNIILYMIRLENFYDEEYILSLDDDDLFEYLSDSIFTWAEYNGGGGSSIAIGISKYSWPYWKLNGPNEIVETIKNNSPTDHEISLWKNKIPKKLEEYLSSIGFQPNIFYAASTS